MLHHELVTSLLSAPLPLARNVYQACFRGTPLYFAVTSAGRCLAAVLTKEMPPAVVMGSLAIRLDEEDPVQVVGLPSPSADGYCPPVESVVVLPLAPRLGRRAASTPPVPALTRA